MVEKAVYTMSEEELAKWMGNPMVGFEMASKKEGMHGTAGMYRKGCRCPGCKFRWATYQRQYRERRKQLAEGRRSISVSAEAYRSALAFGQKKQAEQLGLLEENARLRAALEKYGRHTEECRRRRPAWEVDRTCDCGLASALAGAEASNG